LGTFGEITLDKKSHATVSLKQFFFGIREDSGRKVKFSGFQDIPNSTVLNSDQVRLLFCFQLCWSFQVPNV
jgi:hypothetical protein